VAPATPCGIFTSQPGAWTSEVGNMGGRDLAQAVGCAISWELAVSTLTQQASGPESRRGKTDVGCCGASCRKDYSLPMGRRQRRTSGAAGEQGSAVSACIMFWVGQAGWWEKRRANALKRGGCALFAGAAGDIHMPMAPVPSWSGVCWVDSDRSITCWSRDASGRHFRDSSGGSIRATWRCRVGMRHRALGRGMTVEKARAANGGRRHGCSASLAPQYSLRLFSSHAYYSSRVSLLRAPSRPHQAYSTACWHTRPRSGGHASVVASAVASRRSPLRKCDARRCGCSDAGITGAGIRYGTAAAPTIALVYDAVQRATRTSCLRTTPVLYFAYQNLGAALA